MTKSNQVANRSYVRRARGRTPGNWYANDNYAAIDAADSIKKNPAIIADFRRGRYAITTVPTASIAGASSADLSKIAFCTFNDVFVYSGGDNGTIIDANGNIYVTPLNTPRMCWLNGFPQLLLEGPATNLFLNSFAPATQTVTVVNGTVYSVSCRGAGNIILSGAGTGTVTQASSVTFTASGTSLTLTVSGFLSAAQVEANSLPSSFIQTSGAAVTRTADLCRYSPKAEAVISRSAASLLVQSQGVWGSLGAFLGADAVSEYMRFNTGQTNLILGASLVVGGPITTPLPDMGFGETFDANGRSGSYNGSVVQSNAVALAARTQAYLGRSNSGNFAFGRYNQSVIWPFRATDASIRAKAIAYS